MNTKDKFPIGARVRVHSRMSSFFGMRGYVVEHVNIGLSGECVKVRFDGKDVTTSIYPHNLTTKGA